MEKYIEHVHKLIYTLFINTMNDDSDINDYEDVDFFYGYLGYDLEMQPLLLAVGINGTSDLQEVLQKENITIY